MERWTESMNERLTEAKEAGPGRSSRFCSTEGTVLVWSGGRYGLDVIRRMDARCRQMTAKRRTECQDPVVTGQSVS